MRIPEHRRCDQCGDHEGIYGPSSRHRWYEVKCDNNVTGTPVFRHLCTFACLLAWVTEMATRKEGES